MSKPSPRRCASPSCETTLAASSLARTCSARCRKALSRARRAIEAPAEMKAKRRWVRRAATKMPLTANGSAASSTNSATWSTYREALQSSAGVGLGYVLAEGDGIVCVDLDHCLEDGRLVPWARELLARCPATFVEVSPSGAGLHVFGHGSVPRGRKIRRSDGSAIEVYGQGRYITMTGRRFEGAPTVLADLSDFIADLVPTAA